MNANVPDFVVDRFVRVSRYYRMASADAAECRSYLDYDGLLAAESLMLRCNAVQWSMIDRWGGCLVGLAQSAGLGFPIVC